MNYRQRDRVILIRFVAILLGILHFTVGTAFSRETKRLDSGWRFQRGDPKGAEAPAFNASSWRTLDLPHDWAFEADYSPDAAQTDRGGYKPGGIGWYRQSFNMPASWNGKLVRIEFDAAYMNSEVWVNGAFLGKRPYGYISFGYEVTSRIQPGTNTIAVRLDNMLEPSARWYHGCGLYGHVRLVVTDPLRIAPNGVQITTPGITDSVAKVEVVTQLHNGRQETVEATVETRLLDPQGKELTVANKSITLEPGATTRVAQRLAVAKPQRWDTATPRLYRTESRVVLKGQTVDQVSTRFGIRSIRWEAETGFWINERNVKLKGVCEHLEGGPVGAAYTDELIRWRIQLIKDMGCNAIRVAHNPQVPHLD